MIETGFLDSNLYNWVVLPLFIFLARACDVAIGTIRIILLSRGKKKLVPVLGFVEMIIWLLAVRLVIVNLTNPICYLAFAAGFAMGNYIGILFEEKLAMGVVVVRVITRVEGEQLFNYLKEKGFGVTSIQAVGSTGPVNVIFTIVERTKVKRVIRIIRKFNPRAFYTIEDVRSLNDDVFEVQKSERTRIQLGKK